MKHFFDIGANVGQTFDYLATLDRDFSDYKFWLFEPSPRHLAGLIKKCEDVKYDVTICPFGVGGKSEIAKFFEKDDILGDSFKSWHASDHVPLNRLGTYRVVSACMTVQSLILNFTGTHDDVLLDIDAEGSEYEILFALMLNPDAACRVREIWVEWHRIQPLHAFISPESFGLWAKSRDIKVVNRGLGNF